MNAFHDSIRLLFTRRFGTFFAANLLSNLGTWAQQIAEPWLLLTLGASSFLIGLDSFAMAAPVWVLTLLGGILADFGDRRRVIVICQSIQMLCPALLAILLIAGVVQPWMVIALSLVVGITDALSMPSFQSIVPTIVEPDDIPQALALNASQINLSRVVGPALAGMLMAGVGAVACFALNAVSYLPFIWVALWALPRGKPARSDDSPRGYRLLLAGLRDIARAPHLRGALLSVLLTSSFCAPLVIFSPVLVRQVLEGGVGGFSTAVSAFGLGGLLGAGGLLAVEKGRDRRPISAWFAVLYGAILMVVALDPWLSALPPLLVLAGIAMSVSYTSANSVLQAGSPPGLLGQTQGLYLLAFRGGMSIGSLLTGVVTSLIGVRYALLIDGILAVATQLVLARFWLASGPPGRVTPA